MKRLSLEVIFLFGVFLIEKGKDVRREKLRVVAVEGPLERSTEDCIDRSDSQCVKKNYIRFEYSSLE